MRAAGDRGALAIVLHTHMPYVEGFGTWPFGEEWLWEAIAGSYLPLLELLDRGASLTLSLTPVLCDQLEVEGIGERFARFVQDVRASTHAEDAAGLRAGGHELLAQELERSWSDYQAALEQLRRRDGDLLGALARHVQWTSAATHAVLPLLASDAGVRLQLQSGVAAHRARFGGGWRGGLWLPECAYDAWLGPALADAGAQAVCVELTGRYGLGASEHLRPLLSEAGVVLVPIDRATISLVWSDAGYPAGGAYRDYHRHTVHHHNPWCNDGGAYDRARATALAREHAADFVARTAARLRKAGAGLPGGGLAVCALDTELLGHWWYEGVQWLAAVVEECARQGLELVRLDDAIARHEPEPAADPGRRRPAAPDAPDGPGRPDGPGGPACAQHGPAGALQEAASSWGARGDLSTWSGPAVAELAFAARAGELEVLAAGARAGTAAVRELLALQASDWSFMVSRRLALPYALERFDGHRRALRQALDAGAGAPADGLRNLAIHAQRSALLLAS